MRWLAEMRGFYGIMGPVRFTILFGGLTALIVGFAVLGVWLMDRTGWPEAYGSRCRGRGCWVVYLWHSPGLLEHRGLYELLLFGWLWSLPVTSGSMIGLALLRRWRKRRRNRIVPLDD